MYAARMTFGKFRGQLVADLPKYYLKWLLSADPEPWLASAVRAELSRRGQRFVNAALVVTDLEEEVTARVTADLLISHTVAGRVGDHLLDAFEAVRRRHQIGADTELVIPPRRVPADYVDFRSQQQESA
jgi:hypothetical protein